MQYTQYIQFITLEFNSILFIFTLFSIFGLSFVNENVKTIFN